MKHQFYTLSELPLTELEKLGLAAGGKVSLDEPNLQALLEGRRTDHIRLSNLKMGQHEINELDAKVSLLRNRHGDLEVLLHPIYKEVAKPEYLTDVEAEKLQNGETVSILKKILDEQGKPKEILVEFDAETAEFVITDTDRMIVPDRMNNEPLTAAQKEAFKKGKEVKLSDGTAFKYSGTDQQGLRANKIALISSILFDGGLSYMLYKGLKSLTGEKQAAKAEQAYSAGYHEAVKDLDMQLTSEERRIINAAEQKSVLSQKKISSYNRSR
ncbi:MAG TPA: DUF4099 domain-containing protein [Pedobacter sp.]|nr:DUF4099 domain-containing protein [Pedobacter sp.]